MSQVCQPDRCRFTLLELIIYAALTLTVITISVSILQTGLMFWQRHEARMEAWHQARRFVEMFTADIRQIALFGPGLEESGQALVRAQPLSGSASQVQFMILQCSNSKADRELALMYVEYHSNRDGLQRVLRNSMGDVVKTENFAGLGTMQLQYRHDVHWQTLWRQARQNPALISITLGFKPDNAPGAARHSLKTVVSVPVVNRQYTR